VPHCAATWLPLVPGLLLLKPGWRVGAEPLVRPVTDRDCRQIVTADRYRLAMDDVVTWEDFARIDIRVGRVIAVEEFPEARRPAWKLRIDFGPDLGVKRSSAQVTNYTAEELLDRLVLAVVNFPSRQIGTFFSEVLTLGTYRDSRVLLISPEPEARPGDRLG